MRHRENKNVNILTNEKILVVTSNDLNNNPRPRRLISYLNSKYCVDVLSPNNQSDLTLNQHYALAEPDIILRIKRKILRYFSKYIGKYNVFDKWCYHISRQAIIDIKTNNIQYDFIFIENIKLLPLLMHLSYKNKVIFDAREYYTRQNESNYIFSRFEYYYLYYLLKKYLPKCDYVLTVSQGLATEYKREFGINPILLRSTPVYHEIQVSETNYDEIKLVHHGVANTNRNLHNLIDIVNNLDSRFSLDLYLGGKSREISRLKSLIKDNVRIRVLNHVPFDEIIPTLSNYDIGLAYYYPTGFNIKHALPNKFFEFIQARLAVLTGPSPDMKDLLDKYGCGFVSEKFSNQSVINLLNNLSVEQIDEAKRASDEAAKVLCWEEESKVLEKLS